MTYFFQNLSYIINCISSYISIVLFRSRATCAGRKAQEVNDFFSLFSLYNGSLTSIFVVRLVKVDSMYSIPDVGRCKVSDHCRAMYH